MHGRWIPLHCFMLALTFSLASHAAILVRDGSRVGSSSRAQSSSDGLELRKKRRVAVGTSVAGPLGVVGLNLELNFNPRWSVMAGYGTGFEYQSYNFQFKRVLAGEYLLPYMSAGLARWYTAQPGNRPVNSELQPSFLYERFISQYEKDTGEFSEILIYPGFGLQYVQLTGDWAGVSIYGELLLLIDVEDLQTAPTATLGLLYYF